MLGEITHLQTISDDLKSLTMDPHKLPPSSEQVSFFFLPWQLSSQVVEDGVCVDTWGHRSCCVFFKCFDDGQLMLFIVFSMIHVAETLSALACLSALCNYGP